MKYPFSTQWLTNFGTACVAIFTFLMFIIPDQAFFKMAIGVFFHFILLQIPRGLDFYVEKIFEYHILEFLNRIVLLMNSGSSFRAAFFLSIEQFHPGVFRQTLEKVKEVVTFSQQFDGKRQNSLMFELISEFREILENGENALHRLKNLRERIKMDKDFRHRSGQMTKPLRLQSLILLLMYLLLCTLSLIQYSFDEIRSQLLVSFVLFFSGFLWIFRSGRRVKWKI